MPKLEVYLNEYKIPIENTIYLPLVSGLLQSYAQTKPEIKESYEFMPFLFLRDALERILSQYHNPSVAAFSASMWNMNLNLMIAQRVKEKFPDCLIVFGGPQVPLTAMQVFQFFQRYPFIDVTVCREGEHTFADLLIRFLEARDFRGISGIYYQSNGVYIRNDDRPFEKNLDLFPSPYLEGVFDYLLEGNKEYHAIVETNRGCNFKCAFCFWGRAERYRFFSLDRIKQIAEWCGVHKIKYVYGADSNFGMMNRDIELANYFVEAKAKYGFPEKFRACCGKNAEDNIFEIGKLLTKHDMGKGISLSRQSNNPQTLANIGRKNIKLEVYNKLQEKFDTENIPTYTELILGLPGETYESFTQGVEEILQAGKTNLYIYICQVLPNTELAKSEYQERFGIKTATIPLKPLHSLASSDREIPNEYEEIIIATATLPVEDWKRALVVSWVVQLLHSLKLGFHILNYLANRHHVKYTEFFEYIASLKPESILGNEVLKFHKIANSILEGRPYRYTVPEFGPIYWEPEEASYLNISQKKERFYEEMHEICKSYIGFDDAGLKAATNHQKGSVPTPGDDKESFAREVILYSRKTGYRKESYAKKNSVQ